MLGPLNQQMEIHVGDYVKVEADRGEDLGVVQGIITVPTYLELRRHHHAYHGGSKDDDGAWDLKHILRMASTYERRQLPTKAQEEVQVVQVFSLSIVLLFSPCLNSLFFRMLLSLPGMFTVYL